MHSLFSFRMNLLVTNCCVLTTEWPHSTALITSAFLHLLPEQVHPLRNTQIIKMLILFSFYDLLMMFLLFDNLMAVSRL